jgi:hypothetical protein
MNENRLQRVLADIDAANAEDPRRDRLDGEEMPFEVVYSRRMLDRLEKMYPDAPETLKIAAYGQHVRRFDIPRSNYPEGRKGYNQWRKACREHHARVLGEIMARHGYGPEEIAEVQRLVRKEQLKKDRLSQALENVVDVVFVEHYLEPFIRKYSHYDEDKLTDIIAKTLLKMSPKGHAAALALDLPPAHRRLIEKAIDRVKEKLEKMADPALDW